jgi:hypothetical protein
MQDQNISDLIAGRSFTDAEAAALEEQAIAFVFLLRLFLVLIFNFFQN